MSLKSTPLDAIASDRAEASRRVPALVAVGSRTPALGPFQAAGSHSFAR
jgi:hypothetical protein